MLVYITLVPLDIIGVHLKVWWFPWDGIMGIYFLGLPVEEYLFMIVIPYFSITLFKAVDKLRI